MTKCPGVNVPDTYITGGITARSYPLIPAKYAYTHYPGVPMFQAKLFGIVYDGFRHRLRMGYKGVHQFLKFPHMDILLCQSA